MNVIYRGGDVILVSPMTKMDPVSKGSDHIQGESIEQTERHLGKGIFIISTVGALSRPPNRDNRPPSVHL